MDTYVTRTWLVYIFRISQAHPNCEYLHRVQRVSMIAGRRYVDPRQYTRGRWYRRSYIATIHGEEAVGGISRQHYHSSMESLNQLRLRRRTLSISVDVTHVNFFIARPKAKVDASHYSTQQLYF